ncbi:MAG TPA: hypothetical protein VGP72_17075 [Planctomycetota bacterium]|jgi:hypothetical protein
MDTELARLNEVWEKLPKRVRAAVLVLAGVREAPAGEARRERHKRARKGEPPDWLALALNLLRDGGVYMTNREIARRVGVSHALLTRNEVFRRARRTYFEPVRKVVRRGPKRLARLTGSAAVKL